MCINNYCPLCGYEGYESHKNYNHNHCPECSHVWYDDEDYAVIDKELDKLVAQSVE